MVEVIITEPAEYDLIDIEYYIGIELENMSSAERITDGIIAQIEQLADMPKKYKLVDDILLENLGIRMSYFENYNIFFKYSEQEDIVYVLRVLYNKADWKKIIHIHYGK